MLGGLLDDHAPADARHGLRGNRHHLDAVRACVLGLAGGGRGQRVTVDPIALGDARLAVLATVGDDAPRLVDQRRPAARAHLHVVHDVPELLQLQFGDEIGRERLVEAQRHAGP